MAHQGDPPKAGRSESRYGPTSGHRAKRANRDLAYESHYYEDQLTRERAAELERRAHLTIPLPSEDKSTPGFSRPDLLDWLAYTWRPLRRDVDYLPHPGRA